MLDEWEVCTNTIISSSLHKTRLLLRKAEPYKKCLFLHLRVSHPESGSTRRGWGIFAIKSMINVLSTWNEEYDKKKNQRSNQGNSIYLLHKRINHNSHVGVVIHYIVESYIKVFRKSDQNGNSEWTQKIVPTNSPWVIAQPPLCWEYKKCKQGFLFCSL